MLRILTLLAAFAAVLTVNAEAKPLYICDDGQTVLLTDNESLGCPVYRPQADLITVPSGSTLSDVEFAVAVHEAEQAPAWRSVAGGQFANACEEWMALNDRTQGGHLIQTTEDRQRWVALSRIVTVTNMCEGYVK